VLEICFETGFNVTFIRLLTIICECVHVVLLHSVFSFFCSKRRAIAQFLADRTNGRAIGTVLRLSSSSSSSSVCNVKYCG